MDKAKKYLKKAAGILQEIYAVLMIIAGAIFVFIFLISGGFYRNISVENAVYILYFGYMFTSGVALMVLTVRLNGYYVETDERIGDIERPYGNEAAKAIAIIVLNYTFILLTFIFVFYAYRGIGTIWPLITYSLLLLPLVIIIILVSLLLYLTPLTAVHGK